MQEITYDDQGRTSGVYYHYPDSQNAPLSYTEYTYNGSDGISLVKLGGLGAELDYTYDTFGRLEYEYLATDSVQEAYAKNYYYEYENNQVWSLDLYIGDSLYEYFYYYDTLGNITTIEVKLDGNVVEKYSYEYDELNQLTRENILISGNSGISKTVTYEYDSSGNRLRQKTYDYTDGSVTGKQYTSKTWGYATDSTTVDRWNDVLNYYNGNTVMTDAIGNTIYDGTFTYTWQHGRQLASATKTGTTVSYKYNADGIRTSKTVNGILHTYDLSGTSIVRECIYNSTGTYVAIELRYYYDAKGAPTAMRVFKKANANATPQEFVCYFATNLQGDVIALYDEDGNRIASYTYDAWGNNLFKTSTATTDISATNAQWLMDLNPFRYRGYYYDTDTGLYYLQSRYYNPIWGRFINADTCLYDGLLGHNLFVYCENNPINYTDPTGQYGEEALTLWAAYAWILAVAEPTIIGEILYCVGLVILSTIVVIGLIYIANTAQNFDETTPEPDNDSETTGQSTPEPDVSYPGDDPTVAPDGYEWTGPDEQGGKKGGYKNPNGKDSWHPDLDHPDGVDPHWDYNDGNGHKWRVFPNGSMEQVK